MSFIVSDPNNYRLIEIVADFNDDQDQAMSLNAMGVDCDLLNVRTESELPNMLWMSQSAV